MFDEKHKDLTPKQEAFACAYVETGNASEAYRRAYDVAPDCKPNTVEKRACELLKNGKVAGRVEQLQAAHAERHNVTIDRLTDELELRDKALCRRHGQGQAAWLSQRRPAGRAQRGIASPDYQRCAAWQRANT